ncbi:E3 ubiquitin-protein ligase rbrA [Carex littledalei]|uniref:RBR-type E3 ubiquitin transferase n=1 Tax=Carex littledalei TaxID=544730 RepID=A0A833QMR0_9POAL|nr:E3 ubiquitin-protein ligase rbrA [Carex littledalei]
MAKPSEVDLDDTLIAAHQQELLSASVAVSDLELAYRIQLEEALSASLSITPNPNPSSSAYSTSLHRNEVSDETKDDLELVLRLQAQELERFNTEKKDHVMQEMEIRRLTHDARLREYDEKFAREIDVMPDEDWDEYGDNFEKPVDPSPTANPSSIPLEDEEKPFRVYFKGMVSNDMVKGSLVQLAAIGVAICDPKDNLILKIQKPVSATGMSREAVEAKALIEGLNAALSIGIKKVNVYFDYRILYNHVAGIWTPKQRKVANLINQVGLHQRKFEKCKIFLLPRCHVRFAFRLARDVIESQISCRGESSNSHVKDRMETCLICLELTESDKMFSIELCSHRYCFSCMKQHVEVKLLHGMLPFCPHDGCKVKLTLDGAKKFLTPKLLDIMSQRIKEESIPPSQKVYCPNPRCSMLMSLTETIKPSNFSRASTSKGISYDNSGLRKCVKCEGLFCLNCKVNWHEGMSCGEYKRRNPNPKPEEAKLQSLARQRLWRQCVKCNHMIELAEGCFHMTCRCGYEFCYTCGKQWKDKKATCSCPLWDEDNIWNDDSEEEDDVDDDDLFDDDDHDDEYFDDDHGYRFFNLNTGLFYRPHDPYDHENFHL